jgi:hypothetical protein
MSALPLVKSSPLRHQWCAGGSLSGWLPVATDPSAPCSCQVVRGRLRLISDLKA